MLQVVAVGSGKADDKGNVVKPSLSVNDSVLYSPYSGTDFEVRCGVLSPAQQAEATCKHLTVFCSLQGKDEKQYVVVKDSDILAVLS